MSSPTVLTCVCRMVATRVNFDWQGQPSEVKPGPQSSLNWNDILWLKTICGDMKAWYYPRLLSSSTNTTMALATCSLCMECLPPCSTFHLFKPFAAVMVPVNVRRLLDCQVCYPFVFRSCTIQGRRTRRFFVRRDILSHVSRSAFLD